MNASLPLASALLALAGSLAQAAPLQGGAGGDALADTERHFRERRLDLAYESARAIADPAANAEWRFHVLYAAGDLPGAFAAAQEGLATAPEHLGLLQNATWCALTLGLGERADELVARWGTALGRSGDSLERIEVSARSREQLAAQARELVGREREATAAIARARGTSLAMLALAGIALAVLSLRAGASTKVGASR